MNFRIRTFRRLVRNNLFEKRCFHQNRVTPTYTRSYSLSTFINDLPKQTSDNATKEIPVEAKHQFRRRLLDGPNLKDFFKNENLRDQENIPEEEVVPYLKETIDNISRKVYFLVYGCQMNVNDTEIVWSILKKHKFIKTDNVKDADVVLLMTCAIRESAEEKIWNKLKDLKGIVKNRHGRPRFKIAVLGCMAERLKDQLLEKEKVVDVVAGPDAYRDLPRLLALTNNDQKSINVLLSLDETYADITPVRLNEDSISAFVSIMRGCDNMCTYCIVPFTRGKERSRPVDSILHEIKQLEEEGVREITLLGQNVNSYRDISRSNKALVPLTPTSMAKGFKTVYKPKIGGLRFADLLDMIAHAFPEMRIRFTSPHPKDFPDEVLQAIQEHPNICKSLHMPAQSGSSAVLERMRRGYTREAYLELIDHIRSVLPSVMLSSDFICGFCGETDEEFEETISLMNIVRYNLAYLFPYSMREKTTADRRYKDDVPPDVKQKRLERLISTFRYHASHLNQAQIGQTHLVLVEGVSKRSNNHLQGRNDGNLKVIMPKDVVLNKEGTESKELQPGDYVAVQINASTSQVLKGIPLYYTTLQEFHRDSLLRPPTLIGMQI